MIGVEGYRFVIVGSGFFGAVMAERIASQLGEPVLVVDKRDHHNCLSSSCRCKWTRT